MSVRSIEEGRVTTIIPPEERQAASLKDSQPQEILQPGGGIVGADKRQIRVADRARQLLATPGQELYGLRSVAGQIDAIIDDVGNRAERVAKARADEARNLVTQEFCRRLSSQIGPKDSAPKWLVVTGIRLGAILGLGASTASLAGCIATPPIEIVRENTEPTVDPVVAQALKDQQLEKDLATGKVVFAAPPDAKDPGLTSKPTETPTPEPEATVGKEIKVTVFDGVGGGGEETFTIGGISPSPENGEPWEKTKEWSKVSDGLISASLREIDVSSYDVLTAVGFYDGQEGKGNVIIYAISSDTGEVRVKAIATYDSTKKDPVKIYKEDQLKPDEIGEGLVFGSDSGRFFLLRGVDEDQGITFPQLSLDNDQVVVERESFWPEAELNLETGEYGPVDWQSLLEQREISLDIAPGVELPSDVGSTDYQKFSESLRQAFLEARAWQKEQQQAGVEDFATKIQVSVNDSGEIKPFFNSLADTAPIVEPIKTDELTPEPEATEIVELKSPLEELGTQAAIEITREELLAILSNSEFGVNDPEPFPWMGKYFWENGESAEGAKLGVAYATNKEVRYPLYTIGEFQGWLNEPLLVEKKVGYTNYWLGAKFKISENGDEMVFAVVYTDGTPNFDTCGFGLYEEGNREMTLIIRTFSTSNDRSGNGSLDEMMDLYVAGGKFILLTKPDQDGNPGGDGIKINGKKVLRVAKTFALGYKSADDLEEIIGRPTNWRN